MKDQYTRKWIIENALDEIPNYEPGVLTIRGLHYRLVSRGMTNTTLHYKRVVSAMISARWENLIEFETFSDNDRAMIGETESGETTLETKIDYGKWAIDYYVNKYSKNRWENQPYYPEIFIEKKALQGVFSKPCERHNISLGACKGYPSLTFLNDASKRFKEASNNGKQPIILYFGDYDPSGEDIPRSIEDNLRRLGVYDIEVRRIALLEHQVIAWDLPPAPTKIGDSRTANWDGLGQVELDAVEPKKLVRLCEDAIAEIFDENFHFDLLEQEDNERKEYQIAIKEYISKEF